MPAARFGMKICSHCKQDKEITEYYANKITKDKLQSQCKVCSNFASKESQGVKRAEKAELKELLDNSELGYRVEIQELKDKFQKMASVIAEKHHKKIAKIVWDFHMEDANAKQI